jgi:hypothetical protein
MSGLAATTRLGANTSSSAATTIAVTLTGGISSGDMVIVACATVGTAITAPTDNAAGGGNVYEPLTPAITNTDTVQLWMCCNAKAATIVTMHCTSSRLTCCVACYTGASTFGNGASNTGTSATQTVSTTQHDNAAFVVAGIVHVGVGTFASLTGNLRVSIAGAGASTPGLAIVDNTGTAGTSITTAATGSASAVFAAVSTEIATSMQWYPPDYGQENTVISHPCN